MTHTIHPRLSQCEKNRPQLVNVCANINSKIMIFFCLDFVRFRMGWKKKKTDTYDIKWDVAKHVDIGNWAIHIYIKNINHHPSNICYSNRLFFLNQMTEFLWRFGFCSIYLIICSQQIFHPIIWAYDKCVMNAFSHITELNNSKLGANWWYITWWFMFKCWLNLQL